MAEEEEFSRYDWLVKQRSEIQNHLLLVLKSFEVLDEEHSTHLQLVLGVGFSLWRSVFLANVGSGADKIAPHARDFLKKLIKDNTITYPFESETHAWTFGYYLNNALFRIDFLHRRLNIETEAAKQISSYVSNHAVEASGRNSQLV